MVRFQPVDATQQPNHSICLVVLVGLMVLIVFFVLVAFILDGRYDFAARRVDFHFQDLLAIDHFHIKR